MKQSQIDQLHLKLSRKFTDCRVVWTNAGLLISVIAPNMTVQEAKKSVLDRIGDDLFSLNEIVYRLFVYNSYEDQFKTEATLYARASTIENGMHSSYATIEDAHVYIRELDFEYLTLMGKPHFLIEAINENDEYVMREGFSYGELFVMGFGYKNCTAIKKENSWFIKFE